jgi:hypothetical protein
MPCRVSSDAHEWNNEDPAVPAWYPVNPRNVDEQSTNSQREEKTPWSFTAACCWDMAVDAECRREPLDPSLSGDWGRQPWNTALPQPCLSPAPEGVGTTVGGQFGWGGTPLKKYRGGPKIGSGGTEIRRRVQRQKPV